MLPAQVYGFLLRRGQQWVLKPQTLPRRGGAQPTPGTRSVLALHSADLAFVLGMRKQAQERGRMLLWSPGGQLAVQGCAAPLSLGPVSPPFPHLCTTGRLCWSGSAHPRRPTQQV